MFIHVEMDVGMFRQQLLVIRHAGIDGLLLGRVEIRQVLHQVLALAIDVQSRIERKPDTPRPEARHRRCG